MSFLNHAIPTISALIREEYLFNFTRGYGLTTPCDIHTVASIENRVPLFEVLLTNGVNWTRRPLNAFCWKPDAPPITLLDTYYWDCFSPYIDVQLRARLVGLSGTLLRRDGSGIQGDYLMTLDWSWENRAILNTNFSETPEHKSAHIMRCADGNFRAYPNNRIIWHDVAFIHKPISTNPGYIIDTHHYCVEIEANRLPTLTDNGYITEFTAQAG